MQGSEGTLAAIVSAELQIVPLPQAKGVGILFFSSVTEAMQATVELLDLKPAAIEHMDRIPLDQTRGTAAVSGRTGSAGTGRETVRIDFGGRVFR